jgi:DNA-binding NarL/FixJ family response regulator
MEKVLHLLLADDHALIAGSIRRVLDSYESMRVVGCVANGREALHALALQRVDVLICDWRMPVLDGPGVLQELHRLQRPTPVLILSMENDPATVRRAFAAGAAGFIAKTDDLDEFPVAIRAVAAGQRFLSRSVRMSLLAQPDLNPLLDPPPTERLSPREREVLRLIARQYPSSRIADALCISEHTVRTHRKSLLRKLGVATSVGLVQHALRHGLLEAGSER